MHSLKYFIGKICTILTQPIGIQFTNAVEHSQYYTGTVEQIDDEGIWVRHPLTKAMSFYNWTSIMGIVEEQYVEPNDPLMEKIKEDISRKQKPTPQPPPQMPITSNNFIPVDEFTKMIKKKS
jgi:hypothetical protein